MSFSQRVALKAPEGAVTWQLWRYKVTKHRDDDGKLHNRQAYERCTGTALENGEVPSSWPVSEFSPAIVLARFGAGKYSVRWEDAQGSKLKGQVFEVAEPPGAARMGPGLSQAKASLEQALGSTTATPNLDQPLGPMQIIALLDRREQVVSQRLAEQNERAMVRDREQFQMIMGLFQAVLQQKSTMPESSLLTDRVSLMLERHSFETRKLLEQRLAQPDGKEEDDEPAHDTPPANVSEATERVGLALLSAIERKAPGMVEQLIPQIGDWLRQQGVVLTPEDIDEANGASSHLSSALRASRAPNGA